MTTSPVTLFGPDFPFDYARWLEHPDGLGALPEPALGEPVAIIGAGMAGLVAAYELMKLGLRPVVYEAGRLGGRLRSEPFAGTPGVVAELGAMRIPAGSRGFWRYAERLGLQRAPFPNPLTDAAGSTVIELEGEKHYAERLDDLPPIFREVAQAYDQALEEGGAYAALRAAIAAKDPSAVKEHWDPLVRIWDERTFYDFITSSGPFQELSFRHREIFGQVGFGTGGWDSDFPNSMLEILRVAVTGCDEDQYFVPGGVEQVPQGMWRSETDAAHWGRVSLSELNGGAPRPGATRLARAQDGRIEVRDRWGRTDVYAAAVVTCQSWLLTTAIETEERLFSHKLWMALDRTRYMQSSKTFVMVDRPFWRDRDTETGREIMSMTLTDRMTRGTYLFDGAPGEPSVMCLSYAWMSDALKMLPLPSQTRVELALSALEQIYPGVDIRSHIRGEPITISWEADPNFLGAFKGALPGHYRYNHRMYGHFMQDALPPEQRGVFIAGDDVSWTPGWVEGAVQTALNAVWGVTRHMGGACRPANPGPGEAYPSLGPIELEG